MNKETSKAIHDAIKKLKRIKQIANSNSFDRDHRWNIERLANEALEALDAVGFPKA